MKQLETANDVANRERTSTGTERDRFRDTARKLEGDIAKIRTAVGELKLKDILEMK